jgi:two-component system sensor histidine kinase KdpD
VSDASDTLALLSFLGASLVVTRLTSQAQEFADAEERQRRQMTHLYELARQLLALKPSAVFETEVLKPFRSEFDLGAICVFEADTAQVHTLGESVNQLPELTRDAYISGKDFDDSSCQIAVRLLRIGGRTAGAVGFDGLSNLQVTAGPLAALAGIMIERCYTFDQASRATAATEIEVFRGAVLDALAHEFKTPLATILTAASALRELGPLAPEQGELAKAIESESSQLSNLTSRLLRMARLEREEVKPHMEATDLVRLLDSLVHQFSQRWSDRKFSFVKHPPVEVMADRELLRLGFGQLLDNACKYSQPGSEVSVSIETTDKEIAVRIWNSGTSIPASERTRVFERFYRGSNTRKLTAGSGLGLYVARKIAIVHGGNLDLEHPEAKIGTAFRFTIALAQKENHDPKIQRASG